eukprot:460881-Amorphochlora_amoeboformis.AAC.1
MEKKKDKKEGGESKREQEREKKREIGSEEMNGVKVSRFRNHPVVFQKLTIGIVAVRLRGYVEWRARCLLRGVGSLW